MGEIYNTVVEIEWNREVNLCKEQNIIIILIIAHYNRRSVIQTFFVPCVVYIYKIFASSSSALFSVFHQHNSYGHFHRIFFLLNSRRFHTHSVIFYA